MTLALTLAQFIIPGGFVGLIVWLIIICAVVAIAYVAFRTMGVQPPAWAVQIFWIVVVAAVAILAIKFLMSL